MHPQTKHQAFKEWLSSATIDELEEELFELDETNLSLLAQIDRDDLRIKKEPPTQEREEWRVNVEYLQRWTYYQKKTIERRIVSLNQKLDAELKAENSRRNLEAVLLKERLKSERAANLNSPEIELRRAENKRLAEESMKLKHERATSHDQKWIATAKTVLDEATFKHITNLAKESISAVDRQQEEQ